MDRWEYAETLAKLFCEGRHTRKTFPDFINAREGTDYGEDELFKLIDVRLYYGKFDQSVIARVKAFPHWRKLHAVQVWVNGNNVHAVLDICAKIDSISELKQEVRTRFPLPDLGTGQVWQRVLAELRRQRPTHYLPSSASLPQ